MKKVNITIGRFQPFTNGHLKCAEQAYKELGVPTIVCMINVKDEKVDAKHPFPTSLILPLYNDAFKKNDIIEKFVLVSNADIVKIGEMLYQEGYEIVSWSCGTDRINEYSKMSEKYAERAHLSPDFKMIEIKRTDEDISATKVRQALLADDKKAFDKMTPFGTLKQHLKGKDSIYEILKNQINAVMSKNESLNESIDYDIVEGGEAAYDELVKYKSQFDKKTWNQIESLTAMAETDEPAPYLCLLHRYGRMSDKRTYKLNVVVEKSKSAKLENELLKMAQSQEMMSNIDSFDLSTIKHDDCDEVRLSMDISNEAFFIVIANALKTCQKNKAL